MMGNPAKSSGSTGDEPADEWVGQVNRRAEAMQRIQVGVFGLGTMVMLVGLANIIMSNARENQASVVPEAAPTVSARTEVKPAPDPLADAGVVPDLPVEPDPVSPVQTGNVARPIE